MNSNGCSSFIYALFNTAISMSDYGATNERIISERCPGKGEEISESHQS